jgi:sporulation protein YlmC with PRC-barrel domain
MSKTELTQFTIGVDAVCTDGICGEVSRVVIDPVAEVVTHLVVEPKHRKGLGRLVPLPLVDTSEPQVRIDCTQAEFEQLDRAEETAFLPAPNGFGTYSRTQVLSSPYYGLSLGGMGLGALGTGGLEAEAGNIGFGNASQPVVYDTLPPGEVAVRRGEHVRATDGEIGKVHGLVIDPRNHHVSHVLLEEGHLWGRMEVAIPIHAVMGTEDGITLNLTKDDVASLPAVDIDHPTGVA